MAVDLFVEKWGAGAPVVFLHGLGASARYWASLREVSSGYGGIAPDLLGFGRSPSPPDSLYNVDAHLDALLPLVPVGSIVVAHSTGCLLATALAARHPELVRGLLLLGLPAFPDRATAIAEVGRLGLLAKLTVEENPWGRRICEAMCRFRSVAIAIAPYVIRDLPPSIASDAARHTWTSYSRTLRHVVVEHRVLPDLLVTTAPVRLLHGASDRTAPVEHVRRLAADAAAHDRHVDLDVVPGDHHLAIRVPAAVAAVLSELLQPL